MSSNDVKPIDPYALIGLTKNPDGSITRNPVLDNSPANPDPAPNLIQVLSKDIPINQQNNTWARLYLRRPQPDAVSTKQPLIVYFHGGGFVVGSASSSLFHKFCCELADEIPAVIVSVEYRLAPENRLPAAYDDGVEALRWLTTAGDEWLTKYADFSKCFIMGASAGGNLAYHVGLRAVACGADLMPVKIRGLILIQPFFGGARRSQSEIRLTHCKVFPLCVGDLMWELALPIGADRDHEYCNPMVGIRSDLLEEMKDQRWRVMVVGCDGDPLVDREIEFVKMLKGKGVDVIGEFCEGWTHGFEVLYESKPKMFYGVFKNFIHSL